MDDFQSIDGVFPFKKDFRPPTPLAPGQAVKFWSKPVSLLYKPCVITRNAVCEWCYQITRVTGVIGVCMRKLNY